MLGVLLRRPNRIGPARISLKWRPQLPVCGAMSWLLTCWLPWVEAWARNHVPTQIARSTLGLQRIGKIGVDLGSVIMLLLAPPAAQVSFAGGPATRPLAVWPVSAQSVPVAVRPKARLAPTPPPHVSSLITLRAAVGALRQHRLWQIEP
jgi:hypothetical protein